MGDAATDAVSSPGGADRQRSMWLRGSGGA